MIFSANQSVAGLVFYQIVNENVIRISNDTTHMPPEWGWP